MKKLFILIFMILLVAPLISSFEFDNLGSYQESTKTITITNAFGLGSDIASSTLNTPQFYEVPAGYGLVAQFTINPNQDYNSILGNFEFYDLKDNNKSINRKIDVKYLTTQEIVVDDYKTSCHLSENKTSQICEKVVSGTHIESQEAWLPFDGNVKTDEQIVIGLFTDVQVNDKIEWIPRIAGVQINEWAVWDASLNVGLVSYWKFDESSGTNAKDERNKYNLTLKGSPAWVAGQINNGLNLSRQTNQNASSLANVTQLTGTNYSMNVWTNVIHNDTGEVIMCIGFQKAAQADNTSSCITTQAAAIDNWTAFSSNAFLQSKTAVANGTTGWQMMTITWNGTIRTLYRNSTVIAMGSIGNGLDLGNVSFGVAPTGQSYLGNEIVDEAGLWNRSLSQAEVTQLYNGGTGISYTNVFGEIDLKYPINNTNRTNSSVTFSVIPISSTGTTGLNVSIYGNWTGSWALNVSNTSALNNTQTNFTITNIPDGKWVWNAYLNNNSLFNDSNFTITITTAPTIIVNAPANNTNSTNTYMFFNATVTDVGAGITNVTLFINNSIYYSNSTGYNGTYTFNQSLPYGVYNLTISANSSSSGTLSGLRFFNLNQSYVNSFNYNLTTYETAEERFYANITTNGSTPTANFTYNGTTYSATVTNTASNDFNLSSLIQIPLGGDNINRSFYFSYTFNSVGYNTPLKNQNVSELVFTNSNSSYPNDFLNISYKDEVSLITINASVPSASFVYYLGNGTINKTYSYVNTTNMFNHTFSGYPTDRNINVFPNYQYKQGSDYPQRIWQPTLRIYNSTVYNQVLYLLSSTDGIFVTFQTINSAEQIITGVDVNVTKTSDGTLINSGVTDDAGLITFFLNPDIQQTICFSKSGYTTTCQIIFPTQTSYTITMASTSSSSDDYSKGIIKSVSPSSDFFDRYSLQNFSYTLNSTFWTVQKFEFRLYYNNGTLVISNSSTSNGGTITYYNFNVSNTSSIYMNYSYIINGNNSNFTRTWIVQSTEGREYSIWRFFTDLSLYTDSADGLFGIDSFSKTFLSFFFIVLTVGLVSNRYGINNEASIMAIIFGLVYLFDVSLGFIPRIQFGNIIAFQNFPTVITFLILLVLVIREERK